MKLYAVLNNNHELVEDYEEWVDGIYSTKEKALAGVAKCKQEYFKQLINEDEENRTIEQIQHICDNILIDSPIEIIVYELDNAEITPKLLTIE